MVRIEIALLASLALFGAGCAAGQGGTGLQVGSVRPDGMQIRVENETGVNLRIFALFDGHETPLGRVSAMDERTVRLPFQLASMVQLVARPSALNLPDRRHISEPVSLIQGSRVTWVLRASPGTSDVPRLSTLRVFACADLESC